MPQVLQRVFMTLLCAGTGVWTGRWRSAGFTDNSSMSFLQRLHMKLLLASLEAHLLINDPTQVFQLSFFLLPRSKVQKSRALTPRQVPARGEGGAQLPDQQNKQELTQLHQAQGTQGLDPLTASCPSPADTG